MAKAKRVTQNELDPVIVERIRADIARWRAGLWAMENAYGAACICGLKSTKEVCRRHEANP